MKKKRSHILLLCLACILVFTLCGTQSMAHGFRSSQRLSASPSAAAKPYKPVLYDIAIEEATQKSVDMGHSPWRLDAAFVAQVFVSLLLAPGGIRGEYPIPYKDFMVQMSQSEAVVTVDNKKSPATRVYLQQLVRRGSGGIWTVVGYDPA